MKKILLTTFALFFFSVSFAKEIDVTTAMVVAKNFYSTRATVNEQVDRQSITFSPAYIFNSTLNSSAENIFYIFNINTADGFVIIAGDDIVNPVLGYSNKGAFTGTDLPPAFIKWMENYRQQILFAKTNNMDATDEIEAEWNELTNPQSNNQSRLSTLIVNPLLSTTWDQQPYYNASCPYDAANTTNQHAVTGCPATAMAQIMKYWSYPAAGSGFHSYNHPDYGTLSANFGSTTYNWGAMPNNVTSANSDVATLMFQCGVSVDMQYSANSSGGYVIINSPTPTANCEYAYKTYFGYDPATIQGLERSNYTNTAWKNLLKNELDNNRPVQYAGFGTGGGHTFVCDGYDANEFFHMNWGWSGFYNGFFDIDALNPGGVGTGGGTGGYNANQQAVIGIKPLVSGSTSTIDMYSSITITPNPIGFAQAFDVNADIINHGASAFSGDYCAALFTSTGTFIDFVQTLTASGSPLQPGFHYTGGLTFSTAGIVTVPGNYSIGIFYKDPAGNWNLAGDASFTNPVSVTINSPVDYIQQYSVITATPSTFVQGQAASVNVNLINDNSVTYFGTYQAVLYDLAGNFVESLGTYNETLGLPAGFTYTSPYITFNTAAVTAAPGTYILAIMELENGFVQYSLVGGQYFSTPITIDVTAPALTPDVYESNNTQGTAYTLPLSWTGNNAHPLTTGSDIHIGTDNDYYKVNLASGYNYTITARVHDSYNSGNGNTYTDDVLWSYDSGSGWSLAYDDVMPGNILVSGAATVTFQVAPFFAGRIGTYLLDVNISRVSATGIDEQNSSNNIFQIYPNPAADFLNVELTGKGNIQKFKVINVFGEIVSEINSTKLFTKIDLSYLPDGMYFLEATENNINYSAKFIINR